MKNKHFYQIYKLKIKSWIKYWLIKQTEFKGVLSDILEGISFYLTDSLNMKFKMFEIYGRTTQESTTGKNLLPIPNKINAVTISSLTSNGITFTPLEGGKYYLQGTATAQADFQIFASGSEDLIIDADACSISTKAIPTGLKAIISGSGNNGIPYTELTPSKLNAPNLAITDKTKPISYLVFRIASGTTINTIIEIQLEKGATIHDYEPYTGGEPAPNPKYPFPIKNTGDNGSVNEKVSNSDGTQEQNISFPLAQGQKFYEGSHPDDDEKVHHKWGEVVFDGSDDEGWSVHSDVYFRSGTIQNILNGTTNSKCNIATVKTLSNLSSTDVNKYAIGGSRFWFRCPQFETLADWKAYLAENSVEVEYELAEEQTEDFTPAQQTAWEQIKALKTYKNVTHISSEDETPAELKIQYWKEV